MSEAPAVNRVKGELIRLSAKLIQNHGDNAVALERIVLNAISTRAALYSEIYGRTSQLSEECGWPEEISLQDYKAMADRDSLAWRVVSAWPEECFKVEPTIKEDKKGEDDATELTPFEEFTQKFIKKQNIWSYLERLDIMSGVGRYGVMLLGLDDGDQLSLPVRGLAAPSVPDGEYGQPTMLKEIPVPTGQPTRKVTFLRVFDEPMVRIAAYDNDETSPRFGQPTLYRISFADPSLLVGLAPDSVMLEAKIVHWTRVIHVADNRTTSEILGIPRMKRPFNRLLDIIKLAGSSAQGYYNGAFPGLAVESDPDIAAGSVDIEDTREQIEAYMARLQRYLALDGLKAKSLSVQVADPDKHIDLQMMLLCAGLCIPKRIFLGSEVGELASSQDRENHGERVGKRRRQYVTPCVIRPVFDRLILLSVLPLPSDGVDGYDVEWPADNAPNEDDKAGTLQKIFQAMQYYVAGGCDEFMPPEFVLKKYFELTSEEIEQVLDMLQEHLANKAEQAQEQLQMQQDAMSNDNQPAESINTTKPGQPGQRPPATEA